MASDKNEQQQRREAAETPQHDHTPRREEQQARDQAQAQRPRRAARQVDEKAEQARRDAMAAASIGAQIILDYNREGSLGARGGAGGTIEENTMVRDGYLVDLGLDPIAPSGPPPTPEMIAKKREREEFLAKQAAEGPLQPARATRVSSLAADLGDEAQPKPREGGERRQSARA